MLGKMAWRNLWRHRRRTLITTSTVAFGLWMAVTFTALAEHSYSTTINTGARMGSGHVVIQPTGYTDSPAIDKRLAKTDALIATSLTTEGIKSATPRVMGQGIFAAGARNRGGFFVGIDPKVETPDSMLLVGQLTEGVMFDDPDGRGIVIGSRMAEKLKVGLGKKVVITTTDVEGEMVGEAFRVSGIFHTTLDEVDGGMVLLPIGRLREMVGYAPDQATLIAVMIDDHRQAQAVSDALKNTLKTTGEVLWWKDSMADVAGFIAIDRGGNQIFQIFIGLLVAAGILNTILMSVLERTREFGVLMAIGMTPTKLFGMVLLESMAIGLVGLVLGAIISVPWCFYLAIEGIDMSSLMGEGYSVAGVLVDPVMRYDLPPRKIVDIVIAVFILTLSAGLYPAYRAGRIVPVESLRVV